MRRWEHWAATVGRAYVDARGRVVSGALSVVDQMGDERTLHDRLTAEFVVDATWAQDRAERVIAALNGARPHPGLDVYVLWASGLQAFTFPGGGVYVTRELVEALPGEGALAFVLGHELAHHDLGHLSVEPWVAAALPDVPLALDVAVLAKHALRVWERPEWELAADAEGARLAVAAGFTLDDCLAALETLERWALEHDRAEAVFGEATPTGEWWRRRRSGYLSLRDRMHALRRSAAR